METRQLQDKKSDHPSQEDIRSRLRKWSEEQSLLANTSGSLVDNIETLPPNNSLLSQEVEIQEEDDAFDINQDNFNEDDEVPIPHNFLGLEPGDVFLSNL